MCDGIEDIFSVHCESCYGGLVSIFLDVSRLGRIGKTCIIRFESLLILASELCMSNNNFQVTISCLHFRMVMLGDAGCLSLPG